MSNPFTAPRKPAVKHGSYLGNALLTSPLRRNRNSRRDTLSGAAIHAIRLNNELAGEVGRQFPDPMSDRGAFFSPPPQQGNPGRDPDLNSKGGAPDLFETIGRAIFIDGREMTLSSMPADHDAFSSPRHWDKTEPGPQRNNFL